MLHQNKREFKDSKILCLLIINYTCALSITIITSYVVAANVNSINQASFIIILAVVTVNILGMIIGFFAGYIPKFSIFRKKTLAIEIGMQNAGLGVVIALAHFNETVAVPAAFFTIWCIISATLFVKILDFKNKKPRKVI